MSRSRSRNRRTRIRSSSRDAANFSSGFYDLPSDLSDDAEELDMELEAARDEVQSLIDAEAPSGERRRRIVARFNSGYRGFEQTYRTCTPAADLAIRRYLDEGAKIAREITARYAN